MHIQHVPKKQNENIKHIWYECLIHRGDVSTVMCCQVNAESTACEIVPPTQLFLVSYLELFLEGHLILGPAPLNCKSLTMNLIPLFFIDFSSYTHDEKRIEPRAHTENVPSIANIKTHCYSLDVGK